jgi:hypothetical protein
MPLEQQKLLGEIPFQSGDLGSHYLINLIKG